MSWLAREAAIFLLALQFLTRLPLPRDVGYSAERMAATPRYYPAVGALVGGLGAASFWLSTQLFPAIIAVLLSMAATILATGAFHEDGLADTFDGLGGGATPERALEIMKDSRIGTYGAAALVTALALKAAALMSMPSVNVLWLLVLGHGLSRFSSLGVIATSRYVRDAGVGRPVATGLGAASFLFGAAIAGLLIWLGVDRVGTGAMLAALAGLFAGHVLMRLLFEPKLGGYTGDCLGAVQQTSEIGFYLGALAWLSS